MSAKDFIYGIHAVRALLDRVPGRIIRLCLAEAKLKLFKDALSTPACRHIRMEVMSSEAIASLVGSDVVHQGVVAQCKGALVLQESDLQSLIAAVENPLVLILDRVQDPHNLGACLRTANAMGACCVITPKDRSAGLTPTVEKVACGATIVTPIIAVTNLVRTLKKLQSYGLWLVGLDMHADHLIQDVEMTGPTGIVMGGEGDGLRDLTKKTCDYLAKINMSGTVASLNVSVATAITLYELTRQRRG